MNKFQVGYAQVNINPPLGIGIAGYFVERFAKGFLDDLEASALAISCGDKQILLINVDQIGIQAERSACYRNAIAQATGVPMENIFLSATHTHTGPVVNGKDDEQTRCYNDFVMSRLVDAASLALADLKPAKMGFITGYAPERVAYIRLYMMKDGTARTCPAINDPEIDHPLGELDQRVHVLRFDQENGRSIVILNFGLHADTIGGELISSDWPGWVRKTLEKALDGVKCMCFIGCEGDVGSTHVFPTGGDMNDTEISFDNEMKSPGMARFVGRALAGTVLQVYDKVAYIDVDSINIIHKTIQVASNMPKPEELPKAHLYMELHAAGRDDEIPFTAMELTTALAGARRMCMLENGPEFFQLELTGVQIGNVAMIGIPGEPFTDIGVQIKETEGWDIILPCGLTNGYQGYYPTKPAYDAGGYEAQTARYRADVSDVIVGGCKELLNELKKNQ